MTEEKEDVKKETVEKEIEEGKIFAVLGYISVLCFVPILLKKDNRFALFHGKQGLVLFIGEIAVAIFSIIPFLGPVIAFLGFILFSIASIIGIVQTLMGKYWKMPYVYPVAEKLNI
jgi:uncharacterized membrane protein